MKLIITGILGALFATLTPCATIGNIIQNCNVYDQSGNCSQCAYRFIPKNGECQKVSDKCQTWDQSSGQCLTCYKGYSLSNGECGISQVISQNVTNCPPRSILKNGECQNVSDQCNTWDQSSGKCLTCYGGYTLQDGNCILQNQSSSEQNHQQQSQTCAFRTFKKDGKCETVSDLCKTWDQVSGKCLTCYEGYKQQNGACVISSNLTSQPQKCPFRTVNINGECKKVDDLCNTWNQSTGDCLTCYGGYTLAEGKCIL